MNLFTQLLRDEHGFVLSAESVLLGTVGVIGATVGVSAVAQSVNDELTEVAMAFRSLDQSFHIDGASGCGACVAGSSYTQRPVEESLKALSDEIAKAKAQEQELLEKQRKAADDKAHNPNSKAADKDGDPQPPSMKQPPEEGKKKKKRNKARDKAEETSV